MKEAAVLVGLAVAAVVGGVIVAATTKKRTPGPVAMRAGRLYNVTAEVDGASEGQIAQLTSASGLGPVKSVQRLSQDRVRFVYEYRPPADESVALPMSGALGNFSMTIERIELAGAA